MLPASTLLKRGTMLQTCSSQTFTGIGLPGGLVRMEIMIQEIWVEPEILDPSQALGDTDAAGLQASCFSILFNNILGGVLVLIYGRAIFTCAILVPGEFGSVWRYLRSSHSGSSTGIMWTRTTDAATIHRIDFHNKEFSDSKCQRWEILLYTYYFVYLSYQK